MRMAGGERRQGQGEGARRGGARTIVEVELEEPYAPIAKDTRAILRQKTLLGETYLELSPGHARRASSPTASGCRTRSVEDDRRARRDLHRVRPGHARRSRTGSRSSRWRDRRAVGRRTLATRSATSRASPSTARAARGARPAGSRPCKRLVRNTGEVFGAFNERQGALRELIVNSKRTFEATASATRRSPRRSRSSRPSSTSRKATRRGSRTSRATTRPLVNDLKGPADDLARHSATSATSRRTSSASSATSIRSCARAEDGVPASSAPLARRSRSRRGSTPFPPELNPILARTSTTTSPRSPASSRTPPRTSRPTTARASAARPRSGSSRGRTLQGFQHGAARPTGCAATPTYGAERAEPRSCWARCESFARRGEATRPGGRAIEGRARATTTSAPPLLAPPSLYDGKRDPPIRAGGESAAALELRAAGGQPARGGPKSEREPRDPGPGRLRGLLASDRLWLTSSSTNVGSSAILRPLATRPLAIYTDRRGLTSGRSAPSVHRLARRDHMMWRRAARASIARLDEGPGGARRGRGEALGRPGGAPDHPGDCK